jgi:hypothetical protein
VLASATALKARVMNTGGGLASLTGKTTTSRLVNARRAIDFTRPVLGGGISVLPTAKSIGTSSAWVRLGWGLATDDLAMSSYRVEQRRNTGAWTVLTNATTARTHDLVIALSGTYTFRVTPRDSVGNLGTPVVSRVVTPLRYEESSTGVRYAGPWALASSTAASGGKTKYTKASGASATLTFYGRTVALVAPMSSARSSVKVYVDGVHVKTVSLYSSTVRHRFVVFSTGTLSLKTHTVKLVHARVGSRIRADVDAFVVLR